MPDFLERSRQHQRELGADGAARILDSGRRWDLSGVLTAGGAIVFPHATLTVCGHQIAAAVHACLDSGAPKVLAIGVLHALTPELQAARQRVQEGGDPAKEETWSTQGPGVSGRTDWLNEFSLSHFQFLFSEEIARRRLKKPPELVMRYPNLAAGRPELLPGFDGVERLARDAVVVATIDPMHHGIGYGDTAEIALYPEAGGLSAARDSISTGMALLCEGDFAQYTAHCIAARSDGRDVGQVLSKLIRPTNFEILDLVADDMTGPYESTPPTWVAGALIALNQSIAAADPV